jgi:GNAT superfamily N-acetyltransferase
MSVTQTARDDRLPPFDAPASGTFEAIFHALDGCSELRIGPALQRLLVIPIRDDAGAVAGGLWGHTQFRWLHVEMLLVPEAMRGLGIGSALMAVAEREARNRLCVGVLVDTFSFQATSFYEKLGFKRFGALDNFPPGYQRLYFSKPLGASPGPRTRICADTLPGADRAAGQ